jgi:beta-glucosidase
MRTAVSEGSKSKGSLFALALVMLSSRVSMGQAAAPYQNPALSPEQRAADLVSRMTLEEKVLQMQNSAPAIPRLGVPVYNWWNEALHGVQSGRATAFPEPIALGSTWDSGLIHQIGDAISTEARAKYNEARRMPPVPEVAPGAAPGRTAGLTYWTPNINIFRDPRWGRGQETYGEDPYLTGQLGVAFIEGMQGNDPHYLKVVATPKHYAVHSGPEPLRHVFDVKPSEYDMEHTYLPAFREAITVGKADSIMCVYNSVNGAPGCASKYLLQTTLRDDWGFKGFVVSDCGAVGDIYRSHKYVNTEGEAAVAAVKAGTDLTCGNEYRTLVAEVKAGHITEAEIDRSAVRLFTARFRLGMFDPPDMVPFSKIPYSENDSAEHRKLALTAEREGIVLLKNQGDLLPLKPSVHTIAVVGPSADDPIGMLGNYNAVSSRQVTPLQGIVKQFSSAKVNFALGSTYTDAIPALVSTDALTPPDSNGHGLLAEYFDNPDFQGNPKLRRHESRLYYDANMEEPAVKTAIGGDHYSVRWTATLTPPGTGDYILTAHTGIWNRVGKVRLFLDGKEITSGGPGGPRPMGLGSAQGQGFRRPAAPPVHLEAGHSYSLKVEYQQNGSGGGAQLDWIPPAGVLLEQAKMTAGDADAVLVFAGLDSSMEGEGHDRNSIDLPEQQENLVKAMVATGKPVVVVLTSGSAIAANYAAANATALLSAWYGGEEGGTAIAETLAGVNNPAARLPLTFYKSLDQVPAFTDYSMKGRTYRYFSGEPLYPFGYGLSYSTFAYSALKTKRTHSGAEIRATVKNTSHRDGDEVVQLYTSGGPGEEIRSLRGFQRIHLKAGESRHVNFTLSSKDVPQARLDVSVGGGQPLSGTQFVKGSL